MCRAAAPLGIAARRLGQPDIPRPLARVVRELGAGAGAVVTLGDVHRWPRARSRWGQDQESVRALMHAGLEGVRTALEAEAGVPVGTAAEPRREAVARLTDLHENALTQPIRGRVEAHPATCQD